MPDLVDRLGAALLDASLAATAITGLVVLAMIQCRQPARRRDWARAGLLSTLALLPLAALNPVPRIDLRGPLRAVLPTDLDGPSPRPRPLGEGRDASNPPIGRFRADDCPGEPACPPHGPGGFRRVALGMVVAYATGASIGLAWIALGVCGSAWLVRLAQVPSARTLAQLRLLPFGGTSRRPRLLVSDRATRPVLVGWPRPTILIPPGLDRPESTDRLRLGLLHELAHAEGFDHLFAPAATLAQAAWFFLPPVWWIRDQLKLDQEFLADRRAVEHFGTSGGYASSLVELASPAEAGLEPEGPASTAEHPVSKGLDAASALFQRVVMLLKCPFDLEGRTPLWWRWSTAMTLALATLAASCLTFRGLAGLSSPPESPPVPAAQSFRSPRLVVVQGDHDDQPFDLRFRLPERFTLTFEVMAEPDDLPAIEVLGHKLGVARAPDPARTAYRLWHRVRISRADGSEVVEVDGRPLPPESTPAKLAPWLTIRPSPGTTTRIRDLELAW